MRNLLVLIMLNVAIFISLESFVGSSSSAIGESWQATGYDFRTLTWTDYDFSNNQSFTSEVKKIGSLSGWRMELDDGYHPLFSNFPYLGSREDISPVYVSQGYNIPPTLGYLRPADFPASFANPPASSGDWVHREFTYNYGSGKEFRLLMSRLTPAILLTSNATGVRLLDGQKAGISNPTQSWQTVNGGSFTGNPRYFAIPTGGGSAVRTPNGSGNVDLSGMDQNWFLMWFGQQTYLWGGHSVIIPGRGPAGASIYNPSRWLKPVDMPVLVVMDKRPQTLSVDPNGGVEIQYASSVGQLAIMPLLGSKYPAASETEGWSSGLPSTIATASRWWYQRLGQYPVSVSESYTINPSTDNVLVTDTFTYRSLGHGTAFAPIPPVLALAEQEGLPISFNKPIIDSGLALAIGPMKGVDNATSYTYEVEGLTQYALKERSINNNTAEPSSLNTELESELTKVVNSGHLAPWWPSFGKSVVFGEMAIWSLPWETPYYLGQTADVLDEPLLSDVVNYIKNERQAYPPESYKRTVEWLNSVQTLPYSVGARREAHRVLFDRQPDELQNPYSRLDVRSLMTLYTLAQYYDQTGDTTELGQKWSTIAELIDPYLNNSDWSTLTMTPYTWPQGEHQGLLRGGISETNRLIAGAIGYTRLARLINDSQAADLGIYLFNKGLVSRFAQEKLVKYLYETGLQTTPSQANWLATMSLGPGETSDAVLWRERWSGYGDDARRPLRFDQFGVHLADSMPVSSNGELLAYKDLTPELGRFLRDYLLSEASNWYAAVEENSPAWYKATYNAYLGTESPISLPHNAYQIFTMKAWILNESPGKLSTFTDLPWVHIGDNFYIHKVAETIKAYRGYAWIEP